MKKLFCLLLSIALGVAGASAQNKWYAAPSVNAMVLANGEVGLSAGLALGRYLDKENEIRIDLEGSYIFMGDIQDCFTAAALLSTESAGGLFGSDRFFSSTAIGVGVLSSLSSDNAAPEGFTDIIIPLKMGFGYRICGGFSVGLEMSYALNTGSVKERSMFSMGLVLGFRF